MLYQEGFCERVDHHTSDHFSFLSVHIWETGVDLEHCFLSYIIDLNLFKSGHFEIKVFGIDPESTYLFY